MNLPTNTPKRGIPGGNERFREAHLRCIEEATKKGCVVCRRRAYSVMWFVPDEEARDRIGIPRDKLRIIYYATCRKHDPTKKRLQESQEAAMQDIIKRIAERSRNAQ